MVSGDCVRAERVEFFATTDFMWSDGSARILPASSWLPSLRLWRLRDGPRHAEDIPIMAGLEQKNGATREKTSREEGMRSMTARRYQNWDRMGVYGKSDVVIAFHLMSFGVDLVGCFADGQSHHFLDTSSIRAGGRAVASAVHASPPPGRYRYKTH